MPSTHLATKIASSCGRLGPLWAALLLTLALAPVSWGEVTAEAGVQVLTRGPVHEAFAEASLAGASVGVTINKVPPEPIVEMAPDQRPEGANVSWIPGYWSWDDDRTDFIWVSGVWRDLPPGRQWVPGYWGTAGKGSQWVSGYWGDAAQREVSYLPAPPEPLEAGPSSPMPAPNNMWTPGSWVWQQTRYDWQPGYWVPQQSDWVWSPSHFIWTPRGYVYVPGYWDYNLVHRGVMFAPVYYEHPVYSHAGYSYSPSVIIDLGAIAASLFVQPRSNHYYYGDYYDARYEGRGIYPWHSKQVSRYGDDPIYVQYRSTQLGRDPNWDSHMDENFRYRRDHVDARPAPTFALQINIINNPPRAGAPENVVIGRNLADAIQAKTLPQRFATVNTDERKQIALRGQEVNKYQAQRKQLEAEPAVAAKSKSTRETAQPVTLQLPASPVAAKAIEKVEGVKTPPSVPVAPKPQVVQDTAPQTKTRNVDAKTSVEKKKTGAADPVTQTLPKAVDPRVTPVNEKPLRMETKPETTKSEVMPQKSAPRTESVGKEATPVKTKPITPLPPAIDTSKSSKPDSSKRDAASTKTKSTTRAQQTNETSTTPNADTKAINRPPRTDAPKATDTKTQNLKTKSPQSDAKKGQTKGGKSSSADDDKEKKDKNDEK